MSTANQTLNKNYFIIGISGITCGGKTTLCKLLQKSFPWAQTIHQDKYFHDPSFSGHVYVPELPNQDHANYDVFTALDMETMYKDVEELLQKPKPTNTNPTDNKVQQEEVSPNFEESAKQLLASVADELGPDLSSNHIQHSTIPILILEGFTIFESSYLYNICDVRFFLKLDEDECRLRRTTRNYEPPDCPGYFEYCIWPSYVSHYKDFIEDRGGNGIHLFDGKDQLADLYKESVGLITDEIEKFNVAEQQE